MKYLDLWSKITFKTHAYRKNVDFINDNENIITEHEGSIFEIRISEEKPPHIIGEYGFSVWNIRLAKKISPNIDIISKLIYDHRHEDTYNELLKLIENKIFDINGYNKLILIHTLILRKDYRKMGITNEFIEMIYRDFFDEKNVIIALVKPFQYNQIDSDFYLKRKSVYVKKEVKSREIDKIPAIDYYSLDEFNKKDDIELNTYKLYSLANSCGFKRIDESNLFVFYPNKTIERIVEKNNHLKIINK